MPRTIIGFFVLSFLLTIGGCGGKISDDYSVIKDNGVTSYEVNQFRQLLSSCTEEPNRKIAKIVKSLSITKEQREKLKLRFDENIREFRGYERHNLWDELISSDGGETITLGDMQAIFYLPKYRLLKNVIQVKNEWHGIVYAENKFQAIYKGKGSGVACLTPLM